MITKEIRNQVFETSSEVIQFLYSSNTSGLKQKEIAQRFSLDTLEAYKKFSFTIGDIILGFYKIEDTVPLLQQELGLDAKTAALLGAEVLDFLAPLSDPNWQPPVEDEIKDISNETVAESVPTPAAADVPPTPQAHPTVIIHTPASVPEIRTMASDMIEERSPARPTYSPITTPNEPVYVSTQPTIAKKAPEAPSYTAPLYQPPKPNIEAPLEKPRWG